MADNDSPDDPARGVPTPDDATVDDMVAESGLQLWAAAQTDFDPFEVPPGEWADDPVPVRDVDITHDTGLDLEVVQASLERLDGAKLVVGRDAGNLSVVSVVPQPGPL